MAVAAGIDEAGYGPLLGPLVVSCAAFRVPDPCVGQDLWHLFQIGRAGDRAKTAAGVKADDSKALHKGAQGLRVLEENLLPFLGLLGAPPRTFFGFLSAVSPDVVDTLAAYPWYAGSDARLPLKAHPVRVQDRTIQLRRALTAAGGELRLLRAEIVEVAEFNRDVAATDNKAAALGRRVGTLMQRLWEAHGAEGIALTVDKQGGRNAYAEFLHALFPEAQIDALAESAESSLYQVCHAARRMEVVFRPRADQMHLATALASMLSKYTRELFMDRLNAYWRERVPGLEPTAGYVTDGQRFLREIAEAAASDGADLTRLIRCR